VSEPIDPRLVRAAGSLRRYLAALVAKQLADGLLILAQAGLLASVLAAVFAGHHRLADLAPRLLLLLGVGAGRALLAAAQEYLGARASTGVRAQLRRAALRSIVSLGPGWAARQPVGRLAAATGPGLDSLDGYLVRAVPALVSAAVIPALVLIRITVADWQSGLLLALTLPLVPLFMALVGVTTKRRVQRQYALLSRLSGQFLDLLRGLTTLTVYGQAGRQQRTLRAATERYRRETMSALRVAFLSALVLDLVATLSVAVVAVDVGLRLDAASLPFGTALVVLLLAPELFAPLRAVGAQYHANVEGATAAAGALDLIEVAGPAGPVAGSAPVAADGRVRLDGVTVRFPERERPALHGLSCAVDAGELVVLTGRSGAGKSTLLAALLGFVTPVEGTLSVGSAGTLTPLPSLDLQSWRAELAWLPQRPVPSRPTVAEEVALGDPLAGEDAVAEVCRLCRTPSPDTLLAEDGAAVSAGQRRRIALARVLLRARAVQARGATPLVLLDEPSEDLDRVTEQVVAQVISGLAGQATVIVATHSEVLAALADRRLVLQDGALVSDTRQQRPAPGTPAIAEPAAAALTGTATASVSPVAARLGWRDVLAEPRIRRRLAGAAALAALAGLAGLGLTATSIWLIGRAAEHPNVQALAIAVVGVRTFAIARSLLRYLERLSGHDVALLMLVGLRGRVFAALAPLGPAVLGGYRRGDLLRRFVGDVDGLQDGVVRTLVPAAGAIATCVAACLLAAGLSPVAGLVLAATLVAAGVLTPWLAARAAGDADRLGELAAVSFKQINLPTTPYL
jgi:ATP-binding cassette subfamily C protein CydCD